MSEDIEFDAGEFFPEDRIIDGTGGPRQLLEHLEAINYELWAGVSNTLVIQQRFGQAPPIVDFPDDIFLRHADIIEEHLREFIVIGDGPDRSYRDSLRRQIDEDHADARLFAWRILIGAYQREHPLRMVAPCCPNFLSIDHEMVAIEIGPGPQAGKIGSGIGLGIALTPKDITGQHLGQVLRFLVLGTIVHQNRPNMAERLARRDGSAGTAKFLEHDQLLGKRCFHAAIFLWPMRRDPAPLIKFLVPGAHEVGWGTRHPAEEFFRQGCVKPVAHLQTKGGILLAVFHKTECTHGKPRTRFAVTLR